MVDTNPDALLSHQTPLHYTVEEQECISKTGRDENCEDAFYLGPHFVAVIDGATSKTERRWDGKTGGRVAAELVKAAFDQLSPAATARQAVDAFTLAIKDLYERHGALHEVQAEPVQRAVACFVAISLLRREVWLVGDCQCRLDNELLLNEKEIDHITSQARSLFLASEIAHGKSREELRQHDTGRAFILPLLERQMTFQNNPAAGQYWYPVIDGFAVPDEGIRVHKLPEEIETIVLASDGYPYVKESLEESEQALQELLRDDPLLFRNYKSTKGLKEGNLSFDDRTYVRLKVRKEAEV